MKILSVKHIKILKENAHASQTECLGGYQKGATAFMVALSEALTGAH